MAHVRSESWHKGKGIVQRIEAVIEESDSEDEVVI
jgi:hypothetical protein